MIEVSGLTKVFRTGDGDVTAVDEVSLVVPDGGFTTVLGPSGCGKSTLLRLLAGLEQPDRGTIRIDDEVVSDQGRFVPTQRRGVGMVFQSYAIWPHLDVFANVAYPLQVQRVDRTRLCERVSDALALVGLEGMDRRPTTRLSGGEQQRVALARALVAEPRVLLLDEPLSNLDAERRASMRLELKELQTRVGLTTVYVTHDQQEALSLSDDLLVMRDGRILQRGTPADVYHQPRSRFVARFIGAPNLITAHTDGPMAAGVGTVATDLGPLSVTVPEPIEGAATLEVAIRPEGLDIRAADLDGTSDATDPRSGHNLLLGRLERTIFLGERSEHYVRVGSSVLRCAGPSRTSLAAGDGVEVRTTASACRVLPDDVQHHPFEAVADERVRSECSDRGPRGMAG